MASRVYKVTGSGAFPADMLRYEEAFPADTYSAMGIINATKEPREVYLRNRGGVPAVDRWASFGWVCDISNWEY